jgi:hypothetical protein
MDKKSFRGELCNLINCHSQENGSDTPDFILAEYLDDCLKAFDKAVSKRTDWHSSEEPERETSRETE